MVSNPFFMNRLSLWATISILLMGLGAGCAKQAAPGGAGGNAARQTQVVEVTPVLRRDLQETLTVVGSVEPNESAQIRPEVMGLVQAIYFEEGQVVEPGQLLMKIDDAELRAQYAQVEARFKLAELNVTRSENLSETRTIPQSEFDRARSEFAAARAELEVLKLRIEKTAIKAPFAGVVGSRTLSPGDYVTSSSILTSLNDLSRLKISFQVPERYLNKIRPGTKFRILSRDMDRRAEVTGEVYFVSSVIDRSTRSSEIKGYLDTVPAALKPGMFGNVEIVLEVREDALTVPEGAILTVSSGTQVIAVREEKGEKVAAFVPVRIGLRTQGFAEIIPTEGALTEGQEIVAAGVGALILYPGIKLDPRPLRAEFKPEGAAP
jgi:membrane fusion protein (multidrug efflux system)